MDSATNKELKDKGELEGDGEVGSMRNYWRTKNVTSIDGLPGLTVASKVQFPLRNHWVKGDSFATPKGEKVSIFGIMGGFVVGSVFTAVGLLFFSR
jgi:hypothetical protein